MTVLLTFVGGWGHAEPLLPVAHLARSFGHDVVIGGQAAALAPLRALGFRTAVVGPDTLATQRLPLVVERDSERPIEPEKFVARFSARADALTDLVGREQPAAVISDEVDAGALVAAEAGAVPCVTVNVIAAGRLGRWEQVATAWNALRAERGLPDDPDGRRLSGDLFLAPVPRSFRDPDLAATSWLRFVRPAILDQISRRTGAARRSVYATLGTVFNLESGDLLERLVQAAALVDGDVLVTTGHHIARDDLPEPATNVRIMQFEPQHRALGRCDAVVCHGGSGTLVAALAIGIPVVVLPIGADQHDNADRCEALGVGVVLDARTVDAPTIADAVHSVIDDDRYRLAAAQLAAEAWQQPAVRDVAELTALLG